MSTWVEIQIWVSVWPEEPEPSPAPPEDARRAVSESRETAARRGFARWSLCVVAVGKITHGVLAWNRAHCPLSTQDIPPPHTEASDRLPSSDRDPCPWIIPYQQGPPAPAHTGFPGCPVCPLPVFPEDSPQLKLPHPDPFSLVPWTLVQVELQKWVHCPLAWNGDSSLTTHRSECQGSNIDKASHQPLGIFSKQEKCVQTPMWGRLL